MPYLKDNNGSMEIEKFEENYRDLKQFLLIAKFLKSSSLLESSRIAYIKKNKLKIIFDKFYLLLGKHETKTVNGEIDFIIDETSKYILKELSKDNIVLLLKEDLSRNYKLLSFLDSLELNYIPLNIPLDGLKSEGVDPTYWPLTKMHGHWNRAAHQAIGHFISQEVDSIMYKNPDYQYKFK